MILSFETFNFSCYEKSSIGLEIKEHFNLLFWQIWEFNFVQKGSDRSLKNTFAVFVDLLPSTNTVKSILASRKLLS